MDFNEIRNFENMILRKMIDSQEIADRLIPYLKSSHFTSDETRNLYSYICNHVDKFDKVPTFSELRFTILEEKIKNYMVDNVEGKSFQDVDDKVFFETTEEFMKEKMYLDGVLCAREAFLTKDREKKKEELSKVLPRLMEAESFCFNTDVGLDVFDNIDMMLASLHSNVAVVSSGIPSLDAIIAGGFPTKELTLFLGETSIGKTLSMCALAVSAMKKGRNVLYVTHEMRDAKIGERIVANLIDLETKKVRDPSYAKTVTTRTLAVKNAFKTSIKIKEYATSTANTNHIMLCIKDLEKKQKWKPDIIFVDSVNIMLPNIAVRGMNSNDFCKAITTDLRRMAFDVGVPVISCMQLKREGFNSSDIEITDVAESIGATTVAGVIIAITQPDELKELKRYALKTLKVRDEERYKTCYVNVNYGKMRLEDCEQGMYSTEQPKTVHTESDLSSAINLLAPSIQISPDNATNGVPSGFEIDFG